MARFLFRETWEGLLPAPHVDEPANAEPDFEMHSEPPLISTRHFLFVCNQAGTARASVGYSRAI
jgi:hypothetical protein